MSMQILENEEDINSLLVSEKKDDIKKIKKIETLFKNEHKRSEFKPSHTTKLANMKTNRNQEIFEENIQWHFEKL